MKRVALCLAVLGSVLALHPTAAATAHANAPLRLPVMPLHDPWIVADTATHTYHLYTRNRARMTHDPRLGIMEYTSRDLKHWTHPRVVFTLPPGTWADAGAWAPEVHRWRGRWYLFSTFYNPHRPLPAHGHHRPIRRATVLAVSDSLDGPFRLVRHGQPIVPKAKMTLDGTLYIGPSGHPWLVYAHEWVQIGDGTIDAMPLDDALARAGPSKVLFHASDAPWVDGKKQPNGNTIYVTDGPELFRTRSGTLLMLWSSYDRHGYVEGLARSRSGSILGPWQQLPPLVRADSGHGMLFHRFDGQLMMVLHRPFRHARGKLYLMRDTDDRVRIVREAVELDGETHPVPPLPARSRPRRRATPPDTRTRP
ncbi:glycoside hydrolase family 43 protein [Dyella sp. A6]|uniref:glycoside hydrolase family 43 protein n=1 Tax=Dyella aluminiiresistens TaxID=3069105 RepID=UPI002E76F163|nr:glycoside hydrolase family 43 protein [Dyella sp. A6]